MAAQTVVAQRIILVGVLSLAFVGAVAYLRWRGHLALLRAVALPAALFATFNVPDALVTLAGTWNRPWYETNPFVRVFLLWSGWRGLCVAFTLWILGWTVFVDGLESLRLRLSGWRRTPARWAQVYTVYALAVGHMDGFTSWTHAPAAIYEPLSGLLVVLERHVPWTMTTFPLSYDLYPSLFFGALCTVVHLYVAAGARGVRRSLGPAVNGRVVSLQPLGYVTPRAAGWRSARDRAP